MKRFDSLKHKAPDDLVERITFTAVREHWARQEARNRQLRRARLIVWIVVCFAGLSVLGAGVFAIAIVHRLLTKPL